MNGFQRSMMLGAAIAMGVAIAACGLAGDLRDLAALSLTMGKEYGGEAGIKLTNGNRLTVTFTNSKYADLPGPRRIEFARGAAQFALAHYAQPKNLTTVRVAFRHENGFGGISIDSTEDPYSWSVGELKAAADSAAAKRVSPSAATIADSR